MFFLNKTVIHLNLILVIVGISFYLGVTLYSSSSPKKSPTLKTVKEFRPQIERGVQGDFQIQTGEKPLTLKGEEVKNWTESYIRSYSGKEDLRISTEKIINYLESIAPHLNIEPIDAKFVFGNNGRVEIFRPATQGQRLKINESAALIAFSILNDKGSASLMFDQIAPEVTLDKINNLGITTLLGKGESDYGNSPSSRIHNIKVGMNKFNGIILKPGEEFSFNDYLGEVDERSGYQSELVIKGGKLIYEYGGGLCQVSTTVFRAAIMSGLDITERKPHSFSVQYYSPQGFDATIYPGVVDLKFTNDTGGHVLIQTRLIESKLIVEIYGSQNNKKVNIEGPFQYDQKSNGSMKAYFIRKIYNGESLEQEERFDSIYKPPPPKERNPLE
ncbi:MAG: VanW family protein [bacterium]|nr:VanW family protein [bacterium]